MSEQDKAGSSKNVRISLERVGATTTDRSMDEQITYTIPSGKEMNNCIISFHLMFQDYQTNVKKNIQSHLTLCEKALVKS